jgi:hypothetical protein
MSSVPSALACNREYPVVLMLSATVLLRHYTSRDEFNREQVSLQLCERDTLRGPFSNGNAPIIASNDFRCL